jgi:hypothetical protein
MANASCASLENHDQPLTFCRHNVVLHLLATGSSVLAVDGVSTVGGVFLVKRACAGLLDLLLRWAVQLFLEDGIGLVDLKLGLEVAEGLGRGVGTTTDVTKIVAQVFGLDTFTSPIAVTSVPRADCRAR